MSERNEDRFVDIELKLVDQEGLVESLDQVISIYPAYQQSRRIDQLSAMLAQLATISAIMPSAAPIRSAKSHPTIDTA